MALLKDYSVYSKYHTLHTLTWILYAFAFIIGVAGVIITLNLSGEIHYLRYIPLIVGCFIAFNCLVIAEAITVFIDMELNQRETNELLKQVIKNLPN
jgi:bacteriorhodopsin